MPTELKLSDNKENMPLDVYMYYRNKEEHIKNYYTMISIMEQYIELLNTRINTCKKNIKDLENVTL